MSRIPRETRFLGPAALFVLAVLSPATSAGAAGLEPIGTYASPVYVTSDPADEDRLFVVEQEGRIKLTEAGQTSTFSDLTTIVGSTGNEQGLLSMAFAPDYAGSGRLYVFYTGNDSGSLHVDELTATGDTADPGSRREVVTVAHPVEDNHNGGQLQFGPDDYLYIATGDGGGGGDPGENAQDTTSLLGKLLRIDPRESGGAPYTVPLDNPFVGVPGADEIWSYGLRNPWRFSFDRSSGALVIGDVGQMLWEEINYEPVSAGGGRADNFGWDCREGLHPFEPAGCGGLTFTDPVHEYAHAGGNCSITGGYVSRDPGIPELQGRYLYADFCVGDLRSASLALPSVADDRSEGVSVASPSSFGEDACGRLYVASRSGVVNRLVGATATVCPSSGEPPSPPLAGPPTLDDSAKGKQKVRRLKIKVTSDVDATLELSGRGKVPIETAKRHAGAKTRKFKLKQRSVELQARVTKTIRLKFRQHRKSVTKIDKLLTRDTRARKRSKVIAKLKASGTGGTSPTTKVKIEFKR